jgi:hypothetical protein
LYASFGEGSRAPSSIELGCADPVNPCKLPNAMTGDRRGPGDRRRAATGARDVLRTRRAPHGLGWRELYVRRSAALMGRRLGAGGGQP